METNNEIYLQTTVVKFIKKKIAEILKQKKTVILN